MHHPSPPSLGARLVPLLALCAGVACRSAAEHRADADDEVYAILQEVREGLDIEDGFTIEPPAGSLRARILAGETPPKGQPLRLDLVSALDVAAENSRDFQTRRERLYLAALDLTLERWRLSIQETGTGTAFVSGEGNDSDMSGFLSDLGLTKLFTTGLAVTTDFGLDVIRDFAKGQWNPLSRLSLSLSQPLLRGFGERIVREPLTQAERDVLYEARSFERFRRTFAFDVASQYFRVLEQRDTLANEEKNHESLVLLRVRNENFAEAGRLSDIQVDQARQDELRAETRLVDARRELESRLDDFKFLLGLPVEVPLELDPAALEELAGWEVFDLDVPEEEAAAIALSMRLDHLNALDRVIDADRRVTVAADGLRLGLDAGLSFNTTSETDRPLSFGSSAKNWSATLDFDLPIDRLPERNDYRASLIALEASYRAAVDSEESIRSDLRDQRRRLAAARQNYDIQRGAVRLAERRVESASLNLEAGRASTRDLLEAQEALIQAQNAASRVLTEFILSGLAYFRDLELLRVSTDGIAVDTSPLIPSSQVTP